MSKYYVNKFLYTVDRDPEWVARYKEDPVATITAWEREVGPWLNATEKTSWLSFTEEERHALETYDYEWLFEYGAHFFLYLTLFIGLFEDDWINEKGPLSYQREWALRLENWTGKEYPSVAL
ncbi:hypothetical protein [Corynebacterium sp. A21]|uniref:hypothetical protein n=1 Tax=Corynebacterium sp. A21 TaxID=3457318 RepID=UPI003FD0D699